MSTHLATRFCDKKKADRTAQLQAEVASKDDDVAVSAFMQAVADLKKLPAKTLRANRKDLRLAVSVADRILFRVEYPS